MLSMARVAKCIGKSSLSKMEKKNKKKIEIEGRRVLRAVEKLGWAEEERSQIRKGEFGVGKLLVLSFWGGMYIKIWNSNRIKFS